MVLNILYVLHIWHILILLLIFEMIHTMKSLVKRHIVVIFLRRLLLIIVIKLLLLLLLKWQKRFLGQCSKLRLLLLLKLLIFMHKIRILTRLTWLLLQLLFRHLILWWNSHLFDLFLINIFIHVRWRHSCIIIIMYKIAPFSKHTSLRRMKLCARDSFIIFIKGPLLLHWGKLIWLVWLGGLVGRILWRWNKIGIIYCLRRHILRNILIVSKFWELFWVLVLL